VAGPGLAWNGVEWVFGEKLGMDDIEVKAPTAMEMAQKARTIVRREVESSKRSREAKVKKAADGIVERERLFLTSLCDFRSSFSSCEIKRSAPDCLLVLLRQEQILSLCFGYQFEDGSNFGAYEAADRAVFSIPWVSSLLSPGNYVEIAAGQCFLFGGSEWSTDNGLLGSKAMSLVGEYLLQFRNGTITITGENPSGTDS
jgi:hypothetical protein